MKIDAYRHEVTGFEFEARDERGRLWELRAAFTYANHGTLDEPKFVIEDLNEMEGCLFVENGDYRTIAPSLQLVQALKDEIETNDSIHEAESMAIGAGRDTVENQTRRSIHD